MSLSACGEVFLPVHPRPPTPISPAPWPRPQTEMLPVVVRKCHEPQVMSSISVFLVRSPSWWQSLAGKAWQRRRWIATMRTSLRPAAASPPRRAPAWPARPPQAPRWPRPSSPGKRGVQSLGSFGWAHLVSLSSGPVKLKHQQDFGAVVWLCSLSQFLNLSSLTPWAR